MVQPVGSSMRFVPSEGDRAETIDGVAREDRIQQHDPATEQATSLVVGNGAREDV